jgi:hypothetical protein
VIHQERQWLNFYAAAKEVRKRVGVSSGKAQAMLREACAKGDLRSRREPFDPATGQGQAPPELVKPSQWKTEDIDLLIDADGCAYFVHVDAEDFDYWLDNLPKAKPRATPKEKLAQLALAALDLPADTPNPEAEKRVNDWLRDNRYSSVSKSTIVRARANKLMN